MKIFFSVITVKITYKLVIFIDYLNWFLYGHSSSAAFQCNQKEDTEIIITALAENPSPFLNS